MGEGNPTVITVVSPRFGRSFAGEWDVLRDLVWDAHRNGIGLVPFPTGPRILGSRRQDFDWHLLDWERRFRKNDHDWRGEWDLRLKQWSISRWDSTRDLRWHWYLLHLGSVSGHLTRALNRGVIQGILFVNSGPWASDDVGLIAEVRRELGPTAVANVNIGPASGWTGGDIGGAESFRYPDELSAIVAHWRPEPGSPTVVADFGAPYTEISGPIDAVPATVEDDVFLGAETPDFVYPGEEFVARMAAYTRAGREQVRHAMEQEAPYANTRLDLESCRWRPGTEVTVRLEATHVTVANPVQSFKWNGAWHLVRFDARVRNIADARTLILRFNVEVEGIRVAALRPEIKLRKRKRKASAPVWSKEMVAPKSAFASYARGDRQEVLGRVSSLQLSARMDVFMDCLSIRPGEKWKPKLQNEIRTRDIFLLFWSRSAMKSRWVDWEWRTALELKSIDGIQPHPLEPRDLAPPPDELAELQFGGLTEGYLSELRKRDKQAASD